MRVRQVLDMPWMLNDDAWKGTPREGAREARRYVNSTPQIETQDPPFWSAGQRS